MRKQPLFILCIFFILGIVLQETLELKVDSTVYLLTAFALAGAFAGLSKNIYIIRARHYFLVLFVFLGGFIIHQQHSKQVKIPDLHSKENIVFKLVKKLNSNEKNKRYEVSVISDSIQFKSVLSVPKAEKELDFKHYYKAYAYINRVKHPENDYQFDYAKYLQRKKIYFQAYLPDSYQSAVRNDLTFGEKIKQVRVNVLERINRMNISSKSREFMKGIILADRTEMDRQTVSDFSKTGLVHILAISGSHMVIIFGVFFLIFRLLIPGRNRTPATVLSLLFIWMFAVFIDFGNPVVRSCIMLTVYFGYILLQRKADMLHSMALAGFAILLADSHQIFDVGFQLSFIAVLGIYWLNQPILKHLPKPKNKFQLGLLSIISITFAAQIATLPLVLYYFHQFSLISFVANLIIIPLAEIIIVMSMILTVTVGFGFSINWLNSIYDLGIQKILELISWFAGFDSVFAKNIPFSMLEAAILIVASYYLRFFILKLSIKKLLPVLYTLAVFFVVRFGLNIYYASIDEAIVHSHFKEKYFSAKEKGKVIFWISENADREKVQQYIIDPYLVSRRAQDSVIITFPKGTKTVQFKGKTYDLSDK